MSEPMLKEILEQKAKEAYERFVNMVKHKSVSKAQKEDSKLV